MRQEIVLNGATPMPFHYTAMQALDAAQMSGELHIKAHGAARETLRRRNMAGDPVTTMAELAKIVRDANRAHNGRFATLAH